jgi:hypothetical protein
MKARCFGNIYSYRMSIEPPDSASLLWDEAKLVPGYYKRYLKSKRYAFFANACEQPKHWRLYFAVDEAWTRGLEDCKSGGGWERGIPMMLFMTAHAKMRVALELAFSGCMSEARSILRDGIEYVAHAHRLHLDPELQELWHSKEQRTKEWEVEFWQNKRIGLFAGLDDLYGRWKNYSEVGSHANLKAICNTVAVKRDDKMMTMNLQYYGGEDGLTYQVGLLELLSSCALMERVFFEDMKDRLQFDDVLLRMRNQAHQQRDQLMREISKAYRERPPDPPSNP